MFIREMFRREAPVDHPPVPYQRGPLVSEVPDFAITPGDIDTTRHFYASYGQAEAEVAARLIVQMLQKRGSWAPFSRREIQKFYRRAGNKGDFNFGELTNRTYKSAEQGYELPGYYGGGWIVERDGKYHVTTAFVERAYRSSPATIRRG